MECRRKECVAMLLAGGQGSRLKALTADIAKPAVPFGGKYRIIDFPLSNCVNSGIDTVGILTQYQPMLLNNYIGNGSSWGLNRNFGGAHILPPYVKSEKSEWYKGTANAIYQNIRFIDQFSPEYVLILSGDHIYKMNYRRMLSYHREKAADCTISVINVLPEEASRFGIMDCNAEGRILEFEEKPKKPKSNKASMGIYVFDWKTLKKYLIKDERSEDSSNDFGKNLIPMMLQDKMKLYAYEFEGYWKDVGTVESLWRANMDLLDESVPFDLRDCYFKIYARNYAQPPTMLFEAAKVEHSMIAEGCEIKGEVINSIISTGCVIGQGARIKNSVIMPDTVVQEGAVLDCCIVGENARIGKDVSIGADVCCEGADITVVGAGKSIKKAQSAQTEDARQTDDVLPPSRR